MAEEMEAPWRRLVWSTEGLVPRRGLKGRWDAFRFAMGWDHFLRREMGHYTSSIYFKPGGSDFQIAAPKGATFVQIETAHDLDPYVPTGL